MDNIPSVSSVQYFRPNRIHTHINSLVRKLPIPSVALLIFFGELYGILAGQIIWLIRKRLRRQL